MVLSVWLFARPLSWANIIPALQFVSDGKFPLCHWGVLVTERLLEVDNVLVHRAVAPGEELGIMYELHRDDSNLNTVHISRPFSSTNLQGEWSSFTAKLIGTTGMSVRDIENHGQRV